MISAVPEVFYVSGPREWPFLVRTACGLVLVAGLAGSAWMVTRAELLAMGVGVILGTASAGALAAFLRILQRPRWFRLDERRIQRENGEGVSYGEIDRVSAEEVRSVRALVLQSPGADLRVPIFRRSRALLTNVPLFLATLEDRLKRPRGALARLVKEDPTP